MYNLFLKHEAEFNYIFNIVNSVAGYVSLCFSKHSLIPVLWYLDTGSSKLLRSLVLIQSFGERLSLVEQSFLTMRLLLPALFILSRCRKVIV